MRQEQGLAAAAQLFQALERRRQNARTQGQDLAADHCRERHALKDAVQKLVHLGAFHAAHAALALALEAKVEVGVPVLVMPSQQRNPLGVADFETQE
jgi:hypothetical protein